MPGAELQRQAPDANPRSSIRRLVDTLTTFCNGAILDLARSAFSPPAASLSPATIRSASGE